MIGVKGLYKRFGDTEVLNDISTHFSTGKVNLIVGESGSGKSVFLKCLLGLLPTDKGRITYGESEEVLNQLSTSKVAKLRKKIGTVFQGNALFDSHSIAENVAFPLEMFTSYAKSEIEDRVTQALKRVNLPEIHHKYPDQISGGQRKRVAIARAIVNTPKYLFCDEPNSGLDPKNAILIDRLIQSVTQEYNMTTIVVTHDMNSLFEIGDHIIFIKDQEKKWSGSKEELLITDQKDLMDFIYASKWSQKIRAVHRQIS